MTTPDQALWPLEPHTKAKHEILKRYLQAWFPILSKYHGRIIYLDGFCGPGRYEGGEPGSPLIALQEARQHGARLSGETVFWFIDNRRDRIDHLKTELQKLTIPKKFKVAVECNLFRDRLEQVLNEMEEKGDRLAPTFAFIDPFGFKGTPYSLIERLLEHKGCEAFIYFGVNSINRWLTHPNSKIVGSIVETFGTDACHEVARASGDRITGLRTLYQHQLERLAKYVRYFEMRDSRDRPQYYLFFAGNHQTGFVKMKEAMWRVDPHGDFRFSDATDPDQLVLLDADTVGPLCALLRKRFSDLGKLQCGQVRHYVEDKTAFIGKHMREALRRGEDEGWIIVDPVKADGKKRHGRSFPDLVTLTFVTE